MTARLVLTLDDRRPGLPEHVTLDQGQVGDLGRGEENAVRVEHPLLGRRHVRLDYSGARCTIAYSPDISPGAGNVLVNNKRLGQPHQIQEGDHLTIGGLRVRASYTGLAGLRKVVVVGIPAAVADTEPFIRHVRPRLAARELLLEFAEALPAAPGEAVYVLHDVRSESASDFRTRHGSIPPEVAARTVIVNAHRLGAWDVVTELGLAGAVTSQGTDRLIGRADVYERMFPGKPLKTVAHAADRRANTRYSYIEGDGQLPDAPRAFASYVGYLAG